MGKVIGAVILLLLGVWGCASIDHALRPGHYAEIAATKAVEKANKDRLAAEAEAVRTAERDAQQAETQKNRDADNELHEAILAMTFARMEYPREATYEAVTAYNEKLAAGIRRWERAQQARYGSEWRGRYLADNKLSSCGLNGAPALPCLQAPADYDSIPTVENSMLPMRGLYPAEAEGYDDPVAEKLVEVAQADEPLPAETAVVTTPY